MPRPIRPLPILLLLLASALLQACLFGGNSDGGGGGGDADYRKPPTPEVEYLTFDSLVLISIEGRRSGEASRYWIYRDKLLLEEPEAREVDSLPGQARFVYRLVDSVQEKGTYVYRVFYGPRKDSLSESSEPYTFKYTGPSPSGRVRPSLLPSDPGRIRLEYASRPAALLRKAIIERRVGADGEIETLDTLVRGTPEWWGVQDSAGTATGWIFYRATALSADEEWLEPSPWDSVELKEEPWTYLPELRARNQGSEVRLWVANPLESPGTTYVLYRNQAEGKEGAEAIDTVSRGFDGIVFSDSPDKGKDWWYWVVARDARGRTSPRSAPVRVAFTGRPAGPSITALSGSGASMIIQFEDDAEAVDYVLERAREAGEAVAVDTLADQPSSGLQSHVFTDRPPGDGAWRYRIVSLYADGSRSDPGEWSLVRDWRYQPVWQTVSAQLANRGDRVEVTLPSVPSGYALVLFRSDRSTGRDSVPVDTVLSPASFGSVVLRDAPDAGAWYYRVIGTRAGENAGTDHLRSELLRVDFTGKPTGPAVAAAVPSGRAVQVTFPSDPEAVAYVLERAAGDGGEWRAVDTLAAAQPGQSSLSVRNTPPAAGHWRYRVRSVRTGLVVTEPGAPMRTSTPWTDAVTYENTLGVQVTNNGAQVEISGFSPGSDTEHRVYRSAKSDWSGGVLLATLSGFQSGRHADTPAAGTWYYWVERSYIGSFSSSNVVHRSVPARVVFTGAPEVVSLASNSQGVLVTHPVLQPGDTLQILRSAAGADKEEDFQVATEVYSTWNNGWQDVLPMGKPGFYHYRLRLKRGGAVSPLGGVKTLYYEYPSQSGGFFF